MTRELTVPELSLVVLIGVSGSGKSTFGRAHFRPTEVISSATRPRQKSDEITSVGRKCARPKVDLPEPLTPISTTRLSSGTVSSRVMPAPPGHWAPC